MGRAPYVGGGSVRRVRRLAVLALASAIATAGALGVTILPAAAHICARAVQIPVGQPSTIAVGVTVEGTAVPDVTITIPASLQLHRVDAKAGFTITRTGGNVRFRGGPIAAYTCEYFSFGVTAPGKGSFGIPVVQRSAGGTVVARSTPDFASPQSRVLDQFVYAGVTPPSNDSGSGPSVTTIAGIALVALGAVVGAGLGFRAWRSRGEDDDDYEDDEDEGGSAVGDDRETGADDAKRDAELRARLERFKKRAPNPPPS
jgi:hypothetical protein